MIKLPTDLTVTQLDEYQVKIIPQLGISDAVLSHYVMDSSVLNDNNMTHNLKWLMISIVIVRCIGDFIKRN
jgi:hypothetical protein